MTELPKVSVGIASYNHAPFIEATLESVRQQSWGNIELIISDDCSKDNTRQLINRWNEQNPGIINKVILPEKNQGIARNFNQLRAAMTGEYLCFFAGDDKMLPEKIEKQVRALQANPKAGLCYSDMYWYDLEKGRSWFRHFGFLQNPPKTLNDLIRDNLLPSPTFLLRASLFPQSGFDERLHYINDYKLGLDMLAKAPAIYINEPLVYYHKHPGSLTAQRFFVSDRFKLHAILKEAYKNDYGPALQANKALCYYALGRKLNKKNNRSAAISIFFKLWPYYFSSIKWFLRGAMYLRSFIN